jgi:hypothetical protein
MKTLITTTIILISFSLQAQTNCEWFGLADANWNNPENWSNNIVPSNGDSVIIHDGPFDTFLNSDISFSFLSIDSVATLSLGAINLTLTGDVENNGVLNSGLSRVIFNGTVAQHICGNITFHKLEINNPASVEISCGLTSLKGVLYLTDGILYTNHSLLLLSDSTSTASIATIENGALVGHATIQRHISVVADDWRFLCSPIQSFKLNQITDDFWTSGFIGATYPTDPFVSVYFYDETDSGTSDYGYVAPVSALDLVEMGTGFMAYIGTGSLTSTIDFTGNINKGTINLPVTYTLTDTVSDGWNLVGNPYPSAIDWDDSTIVKTAIDNAIYIWNPELGVYSSYVDGIGTNGGSSVIASAQSFYVRSNAENPVVELTENCKTEETSTFLKSHAGTPPLFITIENDFGKDEAVVKINHNATTNYDANYDALKMISFAIGGPAIYTSTNNVSEMYSINQVSSQEMEIPVTVMTMTSGMHTLSFSGMNSFQHASCVLLEDLHTGLTYDLNVTNQINVFVSDTTTAPRFVIHVGAPVFVESYDVTCYESDNASIHFAKESVSLFDLALVDTYGATVDSQTSIYQIAEFNNLDAGLYFLESTDQVCGTRIDTILITEPAHITGSFTMSADTIYVVENSADVVFTNTSENAIYYAWNFGNGSSSSVVNPTATFDNPGIYSVELTAYQTATCYDVAQQTVVVIDMLDTDEMNADLVQAYFSNDQLYLTTSGAAILELHDLTGRLIMTQTLEAGQNIIPVNEIPAQVLILSVISGNQIVSKKIVKA